MLFLSPRPFSVDKVRNILLTRAHVINKIFFNLLTRAHVINKIFLTLLTRSHVINKIFLTLSTRAHVINKICQLYAPVLARAGHPVKCQTRSKQFIKRSDKSPIFYKVTREQMKMVRKLLYKYEPYYFNENNCAKI